MVQFLDKNLETLVVVPTNAELIKKNAIRRLQVIRRDERDTNKMKLIKRLRKDKREFV